MANTHRNNLDAVRFFAAGLVLWGHCFDFLGIPAPLFMSWLHLGPLGVAIFFTLSGYLVAQSWERDPHVLRFFARRALRIFPGLVVCTVLCVFLLGPLMTTLPLKEYFSNEHTRRYLLNSFLFIKYHLPGVFATSKVPNAVNGSLWSLPVEFFMYIVLAGVGFLLRKTRWVYLFLAVSSAWICLQWAWPSPNMLVFYGTDLRQLFIYGVYFWVGASFQAFRMERFLSLSAVALAFVTLLILERWTWYVPLSSWILLPIIVLGFGLSSSPVLGKLTRTGDYSYGIYIYAFPIQQTVVTLWPNLGLGSYFAVCSALTLVCAVASWHFVEEWALQHKPRTPRLAPA